MNATQDLLTYQEAADRLGLTLGAIRHAVQVETLEPVLVKGSKWLRVADVDTYHLRKGRPGISWRKAAESTAMQVAAAQTPAAPPVAQPPAATPEPATPAIEPEKMLELAREMMQSGDVAMRDGMRDGLREHASGVIAQRVAMFNSMLGNKGFSDPKAFMRSLSA